MEALIQPQCITDCLGILIQPQYYDLFTYYYTNVHYKNLTNMSSHMVKGFEGHSILKDKNRHYTTATFTIELCNYNFNWVEKLVSHLPCCHYLRHHCDNSSHGKAYKQSGFNMGSHILDSHTPLVASLQRGKAGHLIKCSMSLSNAACFMA